MIALGLLVLPVVGLLAIYGLYERIDQYGWTVSRSWGMTTALLLTLFAGGYLWSVVRMRDDWPTGLARTNTWGGVAVLLVVAIAQTPLLDYRAISLASQLDRLDAGGLAFEEFDFRYLRRSLGRPGWLQLEAWRAEYTGDDDMLARINQTRFMPTPREAPDRIYPADHTIPPDLLATLYEGPQQLRATGEHWLLAVDLNDDGEYEYVLFEDNTWSEDAIGYAHAVMHRDGVGQWRRHSIHGKPIPLAELEQALGDHHITVVPTEFRDLQIAGRRLRVLPEDGVTSSGNVLIQGKAYGPTATIAAASIPWTTSYTQVDNRNAGVSH